MIRLERGGTDFLSKVTETLTAIHGEGAYSGALYPTAARPWKRAGYSDYAALTIMERARGREEADAPRVAVSDEPDWEGIQEIDDAAFSGFWRMSALGIREAYDVNRTRAIFLATDKNQTAGYAIAGVEWAVGYIHRIAVHPHSEGRGLGSELLNAAVAWTESKGVTSTVLNVRSGNKRALDLYSRHGFASANTHLTVLRNPSAEMLN